MSSREVAAEVEITGVGKVKGTFKTEYETPLTLPPCEGRIVPVKEVGVFRKKIWFIQVHQDRFGNVTKRDICPESDKEKQ